MSHREDGEDLVLRVGALARVEGEGGMIVRVRDGAVVDVELRIYEPPRFFEALLRGRAWTEPPDITARICGICPVAYQLSACLAIEQACGVVVPDELRRLRRLLYCGEWLSSHALHVYLLHLPDFLGYPGAAEMAQEHRALVQRGLRLKKAGNALLALVGGRAVHPVNVRLGGFHRLPDRADLLAFRPVLVTALDDALATVRDVSALPFPEFEQDHEYLSLRTASEYPLESGSFVSTAGKAFAVGRFDDHVVEEQVDHSHALHARLLGADGYAVGPLARFALNRDRLTPVARQAADDAGLPAVCRNPFRSIVVRAVEMVEACRGALDVIDTWSGAPVAAVPVPPRAGTGYGATEAPRGTLVHRYSLDDEGTVTDAAIVPPTSQNQPAVEADLRRFVQGHLDLPVDELTLRCEQAVRNYDPCISCATHFLTVTVDRT